MRPTMPSAVLIPTPKAPSNEKSMLLDMTVDPSFVLHHNLRPNVAAGERTLPFLSHLHLTEAEYKMGMGMEVIKASNFLEVRRC